MNPYENLIDPDVQQIMGMLPGYVTHPTTPQPIDPGDDASFLPEEYRKPTNVRDIASEAARAMPMPGEWSGVAEGLHIPGYVSKVLNLFDRPRAALAGGVHGIQDEGVSGLLPGGWRGLSGQENVSFGDVFGIEPSQPDQPWYTRAARTGGRFALDAGLDPLNVIPLSKFVRVGKNSTPLNRAVMEATGADSLLAAAKEKWAQSSLASAVSHYLPNIVVDGVDYGRANEIILEAQRKHGMAQADRLLAQNAERTAKVEKLAGGPFTDAEKFEAIERTGHTRPVTGETLPQEFANWPTQDVPAGLQRWSQEFEPARQLKLDARARRIDMEQQLGLPLSEVISEKDVNFMPHHAVGGVEKSPYVKPMPELGDLKYDPRLKPEASREVMDWIGPQDQWMGRGKLNDPRTGVDVVSAGGYPMYTMTDKAGNTVLVAPQQTSLLGTQLSSPGMKFETNPYRALRGGIEQDQSAMAFMDIMDHFKKEGMYKPLGPGGSVDKGWRQTKAEGFVEGQMPAGLANYVDNLYGTMVNPDTKLGWIGEALKGFNKSRLGQTVGDYNTWWKREVLGNPTWIGGNVISNIPQVYEAGVPSYLVPGRMAQAAMVQNNAGRSVVTGMTNEELRNAFVDRDMISGALIGESARRPGGYGHKLEDWVEGMQPGVKQTLAKGVQGVGEGIGKFNDAMFRIGGAAEDNSRLAVAIDHLAREYPDWNKMSPLERELALDKAAEAGKQAMIDYSKLTPFERQLAPVVPFYNWMRGITGLTAEYAATKPERLARVGRSLDAVFEPMPEDVKGISDPNIREAMPTLGMFGKPWEYYFGPDEQGRPKIMLMGRGVPQGDVEKQMTRPGNYFMSALNPALKAQVELPTNLNMYQGRPIDPIAGTFPGNLVAPLIPEAYGGQEYAGSNRKFFGATIPKGVEYLIGMAPGGRKLNQLRQVSSSLGLTEDPQREPTSGRELAAWLLTGLKPQTYDVGQQIENYLYELQKQEGAVSQDINKAARYDDEAEIERLSRILEQRQGRRGSLQLPVNAW